MVPLSVTLIDPDHDLKVEISIDIEYISETTRYSHIYYRMSIESHMRSIKWCHFNDFNRPLTQFSRSLHFSSRISEKRCILRTKLL